MDRLIVPARSNEVLDHAKLTDMAARSLPLGDLECVHDTVFAGRDGLEIVYAAPEGRAIRALGSMVIHDMDAFGNPISNRTQEFVGYGLAYAIHGLNRGGSAHQQGREREPPPGQTFHSVSSSRGSDRPRPSIQVTIIGRPSVKPTLAGGGFKNVEFNGRRFAYEEVVEVMDVSAQTVTVDLADLNLELEVVEDPNPSALDSPDLSFINAIKGELWLPRGAERFGTTADEFADGAIRASPELDDTPETRLRVKEAIWRDFRYGRGRALPDDPCPSSARLRLASTIDKEGNNSRLFGPYENATVSSDLGHIHMPDGSTRVVRVLDRSELGRRLHLQSLFQKTDLNTIAGYTE